MEYAFNDYGEKTALRTFRAGTGDFTTSAWPLSDDSDPKKPDASSWTSGDKTTWVYETPTGLLLSKTDAGTTSQAPQTVAYTYNARGQLATRVWARGVTTTYAYSSTTAEQTGITYSDSTPALSYTYNRLGQSATVGDVTGTRTLLHCVCGKVTQETLDAAYFGGRILTYKLDATGTGTLGRTVGYQLGVSGSPGLEADITYGYDATDRFNSLSMLGGPAYTYAYAANSNLIGSITDSASGWTETMSYNSTRDLLDSVDGQFSTAHKATFAYAYDTLGRRTSVVSSGEIFDRYSGAGLHSIYSYNDRSEVTAATGYTGQNVSDTSTASKLGGRDFGYSYDPIGNRVTSSVGSQSVAYTPNSLNQYTSRTVPASTYVTGLAPASATVTVNGGTASRLGDYFYGTASQANTSAPQWLLTTTASSLGGSVPRYVFLAQTPENYSYDLDGNLTADGRWAYAWDAENRLVSMETAAAAYTAGAPRQLLSFKYDYLGRRVRKTVANWNGSAYVATVDRKFIYDGWNLIAEYDALTTFTLVRSYLWGLDLTRTLQDGGGVGGLLAVIDATTSTIHQPYYDGNGNIHALVNRSTGAVTAAYEYSAFGETLRATGSFAQGNPFRFSSKYTDDETGLLYYGRRYMAPGHGRFLGRDTKGEKGGIHLYAFCNNDSVNRWDVLGMWPTPYHQAALADSLKLAGFVDPDLIAAIGAANKAQDSFGLPDGGGQSNANSYTHFMISVDKAGVPQSQGEALARIDEYARGLIADAQAAFGKNDNNAFAKAVGELTHLFQDATSPVHVNQKTGDLLVWNLPNLVDDLIVHPSGERKISEEQYSTLLHATDFAVKLATGEQELTKENLAVQLFKQVGNYYAALQMGWRVADYYQKQAGGGSPAPSEWSNPDFGREPPSLPPDPDYDPDRRRVDDEE